MSKYDKFIHRFRVCDTIFYVVAELNEGGGYRCVLTKEEQRKTGASHIYGESLQDIGNANVSHRKAKRRAQYLYGAG